MRFHVDQRRAFWGDLFDTAFGDFNAVELHPGPPIAWHRHAHQDDKIFCLAGSLHLQAIDPDGQRHSWQLINTMPPVFIPRGWWHGYQTDRPATVLQFNSPGKWDGSDEERMGLDVEPWNS